MKIIIANTDVGALIQASNSILKRYTPNGLVPENIRGQVVLSVLKNMTQRRDTFDVCAIRELAKMNEVTISAEHMEMFLALHCIKWDDMTQETKEYLMALLVDYFKGNIVMTHAQAY
jgi:hypothetical protein